MTTENPEFDDACLSDMVARADKRSGLVLLGSFAIALLLLPSPSILAVGACVDQPAGLTAWWPGDGSSADVVGGLDAELRGDAGFRTWLVDRAFSLDGEGDFVEVPDDPSLDVGTEKFTVDLWVRFDTTQGEQVIIEKWIQRGSDASDPSIGWTLTKLEDNTIRLAIGTIEGDINADSGPLDIPVGSWIHFAARRRGDTFRVFMNGDGIATAVAPDHLVVDLDSASSLKVGHRGNPDDTPGSIDERGFFLDGRIDETELCVGRALRAWEIRGIVDARAAGKCNAVIDVRPGSARNRVSVGRPGLVPVAVESTDFLDATDVDPDTICFGDDAKPSQRDCTEAHSRGHYLDVDADGDIDLMLHFEIGQTGIDADDSQACLTGETFERTNIRDCDAITAVP